MTLEDLKEAFTAAEGAISRFEVATSKMPIPALNEFRYVASHLLVYLSNPDGAEGNAELDSAVKHCRRAYFDADRMLLVKLYRDVCAIRTGLGPHLHLFPEMYGHEYTKLKSGIVAASRCVGELNNLKKDKARWENRAEFSEMCAPHIVACSEYVRAYETIREELCSRVDAAKREESSREDSTKMQVSSNRSAKLAWIITLIALLWSICATFIMLYYQR